MSIDELTFLVEKFNDSLQMEEKLYIKNSELKAYSTTQIHYLDLIYHNQNITISQIAKKLNVTKPSVTNTIEKLEKLELINKISSDEDKRVQHVQLAKKGKRVAMLHEKFHEYFAIKLSMNLKEKEIAMLVEILKKGIE